ncbi:RNA polymerase sigma factor [Aquicoccus sp. G2-2]|uniref:RNA polymerase sigma factor n=1 Tax=Aquicoccus sp. G2-2 TaxID=3092120 RepID=UPI002ADF4EB9|nr:RNA polymerase sigma factor [Aquicoccus sp. G2-2]MEA1113660.1 RNA polymerase sigma factor [Aquicoccus sp. G2-2]
MALKLTSVPPPQHDTRTDAELVGLAREGDEMAVRELIRRCNKQLFRVARGILHNDAEAEDVVQAAYVAAFTKLASFRGDASFLTWITRITMNEAYARRRKQAHVVDLVEYRKEAEGGIANTMRPPPTTPEAELGRTEIRAFLERAIDALPEPLRLTYVLRDVQEMSTREVARLLGINAITVKTRLHRARRKLREDVKQNLSTEFTGVFPFDGDRCVDMADRVIRALRDPSAG